MSRNLDRLAALGRHPPDLVRSAPVGGEIYRSPVGRPRRASILPRTPGQLTQLPATRRNDEDVRVPVGPRVEDELPAIRRPPGHPDDWSVEVRHRLRIVAIRIRDPQFARAAAIG